MTNNILACRCKNCGDLYNLGEVIKDMNIKDIESFVMQPKTCLRCSSSYIPASSTYNMDEFVFKAVRTVKM